MKKGNKEVVLCPFHTETVGSCCVNHDTKTFNCYGCGAYGDIGKHGEFVLAEELPSSAKFILGNV